MTNTNLTQLQSFLGYTFTDSSLLEKALTHRSYLNESGLNESNERLEFLGDAVLELLVSEYLYQLKSTASEGVLTADRSAIVRTESLANQATKLHLGEYLKMSHGEEKSGGRLNNSLLANTFEAVLGAVYIDGGYQATKTYITEHLLSMASSILEKGTKDAKSLLQEKVQTLGYASPVYRTLTQTGPDHDKTFIVAVEVGDRQLATGEGHSKQSAQQSAAETALVNLPPQVIK